MILRSVHPSGASGADLWERLDAQAHFGQNKVQYEKFDFKVKKTEHFDIYYYPEEEQAVDLAARVWPNGVRACRACSATS